MPGTHVRGKTCVVTGGASGFGEAVARSWAGDGYFLSGQAANSTPGRASDTKSESERG